MPKARFKLRPKTHTKEEKRTEGLEEDSSDEEQPSAFETPEETPGPSEILKQIRRTVHRKAFKADFSHASFEARVDGYLEDGPTGKVRTLIEVKPVHRRLKRALINMQEAAQMVAWAKSDTDLDLILIEFADYVDYLNNKPGRSTGPHFLTMHEYGPWNITSSVQMNELGAILLAIALQPDSDLREEERRQN
ncbi:hypothetical protein ASPACDRAFT_1889131 [Aspergillus aculeatus ATCC 16872]|uniref:Uncharacterized protein n=1 Tax=Aspergillus aculeatus (strain ATCC 16872 / CBS 172.66 / WB 5094) TaxID=690307 RepID=A0A1L9WRG3_ASPA1|nr:uncharacterized protein ASPACDRAFT_1889131 [Aspergillus aculeatus ATCC 16872]OJJ98607.1 hypothetical protein ASPACDRAFT_1889131 [Aspergillus aculeatus ATCC 16872]